MAEVRKKSSSFFVDLTKTNKITSTSHRVLVFKAAFPNKNKILLPKNYKKFSIAGVIGKTDLPAKGEVFKIFVNHDNSKSFIKIKNTSNFNWLNYGMVTKVRNSGKFIFFSTIKESFCLEINNTKTN